MGRPYLLASSLALVVGCASVVSPTPTPPVAPTPSPSPIASVIPTATLVATATPVGTNLAVEPDQIAAHLDALQQIADDNDGIRAAGTPGYDASADYVAQVMTGLGYQVERQPFDFPFFDEIDPPTLTVGDQTWTAPEWIHAALYSASGDVSGELEDVGVGGRTLGCDASEWSGFTAGHIAVVDTGFCITRDKVELAQAAGAVAMISLVDLWEANEIKRPTLLDPAGISIPVIVVGREPAQFGLNGQSATISVHGDSHTATVENIIATLPGQTDDVVMLGGHLDSVLDGPGINDNGSGVATLMSLATSLAALPPPLKTVRFGFWSAEEFGDLGSAAYVDQLSAAERQQITAYLNLDMVGSPNPGRYVYSDAAAPSGSSDVTQDLLRALSDLGAPGVPADMGSNSDHFAFEQAGVTIGGVFSGLDLMSMSDAQVFGGTPNARMDPCYHLACDTTENVDLDSATLLGQAIADVLFDLANQP